MRPPVRRVHFQVGDKVEVCSDEEGFKDSYYEATIESCLENGTYMVRYKNLIEDNESKRPLREVVYPKSLRPLPPRIPVPEFTIYQRVDAFDNDGWWMGKVTMIYPPEKKRGLTRYTVYFRSTDEVVTYPSNRVRIHQEWMGGEWIPM